MVEIKCNFTHIVLMRNRLYRRKLATNSWFCNVMYYILNDRYLHREDTQRYKGYNVMF